MARAPDERAKKAKELYNLGYRLTDIAKEIGVSEGTVRSWKSRHHWDENINATLQKKRCIDAIPKKMGREAVDFESEMSECKSDLTAKQQLFCCFYVKCFNATKAYQKAYGVDHLTAAAAGARMLRNVKVKEYIQDLKQGRLNREMLSEEDIVQKYIDIAFADITDYVEFGQEEVQVMAMYGPVEIKDPETGEKRPLMKKVNTVRFRESSEVDGTLIAEVKQGRDGASIKLPDRMKALEWLAEHMDLATEEQKVRIEILKAKSNMNDQEGNEDDGFIEALNGTAAEDWKNEEKQAGI